ncbi:ThuA domain-containing protein [Paenibacillus solisilvae]|uniref:ThuA domain-containing protein n=1 Tax=Paenibacillus solisilvae TaxID=2486751 RepID=A0ABW0W648_9BACL
MAQILREEHFNVEISDTLDVFLDTEKLKRTDLIVPLWTAGVITRDQLHNLLSAVAAGTGLAGLHGMADAFRCEIEYQGMVGGQYLEHPGDQVTYRVHFPYPYYPLVAGIGDFFVKTEQYYLMVDPSIQVLATSYFDRVNPPLVWRPVVMPVAWIKQYGSGRVYYTSLGHSPDIVKLPQVTAMLRRGMVWAAR